MKKKLFGFFIALLAIATVSVIQINAKASVDTTRDCDKFAVIYCGTMSVNEIQNKYDQGAKIFAAMGIHKNEIGGSHKMGVVYKDGTVTAGGKLVAKNARTAIRNMSGGAKIKNTNAAIYPTSRMGSAQQAIVFFDKDGRFKFAVMTPCGNPVTGNPTQPPAPRPPEPPRPQPTVTCDSLTVTPISRTNFRFNVAATAKNGATINSYTYVVTKDGKEVLNTTVSSAEHAYTATDAGKYSVQAKVNTNIGNGITSSNCAKQFEVEIEKIPGVKIEKTVNGKKLDQVKVGEQFIYQLKVTNTGNVALKNVVVTDTAPSHVQFISTDKGTIVNNSLSYTISELAVGGVNTINITAKAVSESASGAVNEACVNAPEVNPSDPTKPDDCDTAVIEIEKIPGVKIEKTVNGKKLDQVKVGEQFIYQLKVTNTGNVALKNVVVTDTAPSHVQFISTDKGTIVNNSLSYTISELAVGGVNTINITAKAVSESASGAVNEACVNAPEVNPSDPTKPDDCDTAVIEVPIEVCDLATDTVISINQKDYDSTKHSRNLAECDKIEVCDPKTGDTTTAPKHESGNYLPVDSEECKDKVPPVTPPAPTTPTPKEQPIELPKTGPEEAVVQIVGAMSLAGASSYYLSSRRRNN
jgi:uncharacterized repeat protein (TIGR01451 family)/LPXTG-motif cell wall-anchored protein